MTAPWRQDVDRLIDAALPELIAIRHDLHAHPQLAYEETYAACVVRRELERLGVAFEADLATTGVVAWIVPDNAGAARRGAIALRADMDALPITERTGLPYAATGAFHGRMHACGHDGHTTILLGAARVLAHCSNRLTRPVKLLFQPAEEGGGGAARLIDDGSLDARVGGIAVERVFGLHNWPQLPHGLVATRTGPIMASTDLFHIVMTGRGGHGAMPHTTRDPIVAAAAIVTALQTIVSRNVAPTDPAVLSVTQFHSGTTDNVTPEEAILTGTMRSFDATTRQRIIDRLVAVVQGVAAAHDCSAEVRIHEGYPPTVNDEQAVTHALAAAHDAGLATHTLDVPATVAEDFAFYGRRVPACFVLLGARPQGASDTPDLHTPDYDFSDALIAPAVRLFAAIALAG